MSPFYDTLRIEYGECPPDCTLCEEACIKEKGESEVGFARIKTAHAPQVNFHGALTCVQCSEPRCEAVCPAGAIHKSQTDGVVRIDEQQCVGCGLCTLACPYGGVYYSPEKNKAFKCDMCDGEPEPKCVQACPYGVLSISRSRSVYRHLKKDVMSHSIPLCQGCGLELSSRFALRVLGEKVIAASGPGCGIMTTLPSPGGSVLLSPSVGCLMTNSPAIMGGVKRYYRRLGENVTCVIFAGDGMTADVGFQALSGAAERGESMIYICNDNEGYMNTGIQRSGSTPLLSWTSTTPVSETERGKEVESKNMALLMAFHNIPYVATATMAFPEDFANKLLKAKAVKEGMSYIHVLCPCPTGWRAPIDSTVELSKMAVETNYFPLWEFEQGKFLFTYQPKIPKPIVEFTNLMGRFSHLTEEELEKLQKMVDSRFNLIESLTKLELANRL